MTSDISFTFNGEEIRCVSGQSIAASLIAADKRELRKTRFGDEPRSIFCGIGICYDCVVVVDGVANQRSCLIEAKQGMKVESAP
jgi:aerobic-type carbon monoxide dehydrogenase small subunit (CoxS/CutS family)